MHWDWARPRARTLVTCAVAAGAVLAGDRGLQLAAAAPAAPSASSLHPSAVTSSPRTASAVTASPSPSVSCAAQVFGRLTEAQRVGQLFLVGVTDDIAGPQTTAALQQYHFGSLLLYPTSEGITALAAATAHMQALGTANDGGVRMFIAANQEGGAGPAADRARFFRDAVRARPRARWSTATLRSAATQLGARAARRRGELRPGAGDGRGAGRHGRVERADRGAGQGVRLHAGGQRGARGGVHHRDGLGRGSDGGQALPRARPGDREHRLHRRTWSTTSPRRTIPTSESFRAAVGAGSAVRDGGPGHLHADRPHPAGGVLAHGDEAGAVGRGRASASAA